MLGLCKLCIVWTPLAVPFDSLLDRVCSETDFILLSCVWHHSFLWLLRLVLYLMPLFSASPYCLKTAHVTETTKSWRFVLRYVKLLGLMNDCNCLLFHLALAWISVSAKCVAAFRERARKSWSWRHLSLSLIQSLSLSLCLLVKTIIYLRIQNLNQYGFCKELYTYLVALQQLLCRHHSHQFTVKISFTDGTLQWKGFSNWETSSGYTLIQYALNYTWIWMDWWMDWLQMVLLALFESHSQKGYNINNSCIYSYYHLNICH